MTRRRMAYGAAVASIALFGGGLASAQLGSILKGGAIAVAVDRFGKDIDKAINTVTMRKNAGGRDATKVVPILSIGDGGYLGAAQVAGPQSRLDRVRAVAQIEGDFKAIGGVRLKALVPVETKSPQKGIKRVEGVGVSAIVDFKL